MKNKFIILLLPLLLFSLFAFSANAEQSGEVRSEQSRLSARAAPGETLPFAVKLLNFGFTKRTDVQITYRITDSAGNEIYSESETVAVETTASFVKDIPIPPGTPPGTYLASSDITYPGQVEPAHSEFYFSVEPKIFGLWQRDFYLYGGGTILFAVLIAILARAFIRHRRASRFAPHDYRNVPYAERVFYELISDTVMSMRQRVGDQALIIASQIDGLKIDEQGKVIQLTAKPSKVIADLVSRYEKLGQKVSFSFRGRT